MKTINGQIFKKLTDFKQKKRKKKNNEKYTKSHIVKVLKTNDKEKNLKNSQKKTYIRKNKDKYNKRSLILKNADQKIEKYS